VRGGDELERDTSGETKCAREICMVEWRQDKESASSSRWRREEAARGVREGKENSREGGDEEEATGEQVQKWGEAERRKQASKKRKKERQKEGAERQLALVLLQASIQVCHLLSSPNREMFLCFCFSISLSVSVCMDTD